MELFTNGYYLHKQQQISQISRRATSLKQMQEELRKRGITMQFSEGRDKFISFSTARNFKIHSRYGKDRIYTTIIENRVQKNADDHWKDKQIEELKSEVGKQYDRFDSVRNNREERNKLEQKDLFSNRGLER